MDDDSRRDAAEVMWDGDLVVEADIVDRAPPGTGVLVRDRLDRPEAEIYVRPQVIKAAQRHALEHPTREIAGVLLGELCEPSIPRARRFVLVQHALAFPAVGGSASVLITPEMFHEAHLQAESRGKTIVGWYHSHPNWGVFLSESDHATVQQVHFTQPWHVALVVDAIRREHGFFIRHVGGDRAERADYFRVWGEEAEDEPETAPEDDEEAAAEPEADAEAAEGTEEVAPPAPLPPDEDKLLRAMEGLSPDGPNALPLLSTTAVEVEVEIGGRRRKQTLTPRPKPCTVARRESADSAPAVGVTIDQAALAEREKALWRDPDEVGLLLGRFGCRGRDQHFIVVQDFLPLPAPEVEEEDEGEDAEPTAQHWLEHPDELADFAARAAFRERPEGRTVVGWYFRAPKPAASMPERYDAVRRTVFPDHRFVSLVFFGSRTSLGTVELDDRDVEGSLRREEGLAHQVFVAHGRRVWDEAASPLTSVDLLPSEPEAEPPAKRRNPSGGSTPGADDDDGDSWRVVLLAVSCLVTAVLAVLLIGLRREWLVGGCFAAAAIGLGIAASLGTQPDAGRLRRPIAALSLASGLVAVAGLALRFILGGAAPAEPPGPPPGPPDASQGEYGSTIVTPEEPMGAAEE